MEAELNQIVESTLSIEQSFADTSKSVSLHLLEVNEAIDVWERTAPALYELRKKLTLCEQILTGQRKVESFTVKEEKPKKEKKRRYSKERVFTKKKSDVLNDAVIEKIRDFIADRDEYCKSKEIYEYLVKENITDAFKSPMAFAQALARVDQNMIVYNDHYTVQAWGLPSFGSPVHSRRRAVKEGARITSFSPN